MGIHKMSGNVGTLQTAKKMVGKRLKMGGNSNVPHPQCTRSVKKTYNGTTKL